MVDTHVPMHGNACVFVIIDKLDAGFIFLERCHFYCFVLGREAMIATAFFVKRMFLV